MVNIVFHSKTLLHILPYNPRTKPSYLTKMLDDIDEFLCSRNISSYYLYPKKPEILYPEKFELQYKGNVFCELTTEDLSQKSNYEAVIFWVDASNTTDSLYSFFPDATHVQTHFSPFNNALLPNHYLLSCSHTAPYFLTHSLIPLSFSKDKLPLVLRSTTCSGKSIEVFTSLASLFQDTFDLFLIGPKHFLSHMPQVTFIPQHFGTSQLRQLESVGFVVFDELSSFAFPFALTEMLTTGFMPLHYESNIEVSSLLSHLHTGRQFKGISPLIDFLKSSDWALRDTLRCSAKRFVESLNLEAITSICLKPSEHEIDRCMHF